MTEEKKNQVIVPKNGMINRETFTLVANKKRQMQNFEC